MMLGSFLDDTCCSWDQVKAFLLLRGRSSGQLRSES